MSDSQLDRSIHNERTKLLAGALDRVSTGSFITGIIAPITSQVRSSSSNNSNIWLSLMLFVGFFITGVGLHRLAQQVLGDLR